MRSCVLWRRHASVAAGLALMLCVGSNHSISVWNAQLQRLLGYSQAEISFICSMASFGAYFSVSPGFIFDRIGAHNSVVLGGLLLAGIYFGLYKGLVMVSSAMDPIGVGVAFMVLGQATNFGVFAALGPNEGLFGDDHRGKIMALELAGFSAGGALFAFIYQHAFDGDVPGYFKFMAGVFLAVFAIAWCALYRSSLSDDKHGVVAGREHALDEFMPVSPWQRDAEPVCHDSVDITGWALLADTRFWLLFTTVFVLVGSSLFVMSNIAFIVESLGGPTQQIPAMVSLFSIGNCSGRVITGAISDRVRESWPRIYFVSLASVSVGLIHALFLVAPPSVLAVPVTLAGVADGVMFAAFPVLTRETFGATHFGKNFGLISVANAVAFPLFFNPLGSLSYRMSSATIDGVEKCFGAQCFRPVFLLVVALSAVSLAASLKFARQQQYVPLP